MSNIRAFLASYCKVGLATELQVYKLAPLRVRGGGEQSPSGRANLISSVDSRRNHGIYNYSTYFGLDHHHLYPDHFATVPHTSATSYICLRPKQRVPVGSALRAGYRRGCENV